MGKWLRLNDINKFVQTWNQKSEKYVYDAISDYLPGKRAGVSCRNCDWVRSHRHTVDGPLGMKQKEKTKDNKRKVPFNMSEKGFAKERGPYSTLFQVDTFEKRSVERGKECASGLFTSF